MNDHVRRIGYIRVSPSDLNPGVQTDALTHAGCGDIHYRTASENPPAREALHGLRELLGEGGTLMDSRFDRLDCSGHRATNLQQQLAAMDVQLAVAAEQNAKGDSDAN